MSALGQKQTSRHLQPMSALPPKADIAKSDRHVRFVPKADINPVSVNDIFSSLVLWSHHNCAAGHRHLGQGERRLGLGRHFRRWRVQDGGPEPRIEGMTTAIAYWH